MLKFFKFIMIILSLNGVVNASQSLPLNYVKKTITQQINEQRAVYDELYTAFLNYQKNPEGSEKPANLHLAGLFPILENAVALVHAHMNTLQLSSEDKGYALEGLQKIYDEIVQSNEQKKITYEFFLRSTESLAHLEDFIKAIMIPRHSKYDLIWFGGMGHKTVEDAYRVFESTIIYKRPVIEIDSIEKDPTLRNLRGDKNPELRFQGSKKLFSPTIIIYGDYQKQTLIPIKFFVDQSFAKPYTTGLAIFDPLNKKYHEKEDKKDGKIGTKKDPHYSNFNGTFRMFHHDLSHVFEKWLTFKEISQKYKIKKWPEALDKINDLRVFLSKNPEKKNDAMILENGLFILSHEILNVFRNTPGQHNPRQPTPLELIRSVSTNMQEAARSLMEGNNWGANPGFKPELSQEYKEYFRDHEFILFRQGVHDDQGPFVNFSELKPLSSEKLKIRKDQVISGYKRFWKKFEEIISEHITNPEDHSLIFGNPQNVNNQSDNHNSTLDNSFEDSPSKKNNNLKISLEEIPNSAVEDSPHRKNSPSKKNNNFKISLEEIPNSAVENSPHRKNSPSKKNNNFKISLE